MAQVSAGTLNLCLFNQIGLRMAPKGYAWSVEQNWFPAQLRRPQPSNSHAAIIAAVHAKFGQHLARSTLSQWIKQGDAIETQFDASASNEAKRARLAKNPKLEQALFLWYKRHETRGSPISGEVLTAKAKELAAKPELEVTEGFDCSSGWVTNFQKRYGKTGSLCWSLGGLCTRNFTLSGILRTIVGVRYIESHLYTTSRCAQCLPASNNSGI